MPKPKISDPNPSSLAAPTPMEGAPDSRLRNAWQAWDIASELDKQDVKRAQKRGRVYRAYNRFPPSEYSLLAKQGMSWQSNVNFGMMNYIVNNSLSTYYDLVTERVYAASIKTKHGTLRERGEWSDHISAAFDKVLRHCDDYLMNVEQDLLDMLLYSKGIQMKESKEGVFMEHIPADDVLFPDGTKVSLCNFDVCAVKRSYSLHELWGKVKDEDAAKEMGWDRGAVLRAMMYQRKEWRKTYSNDVNKWSKDVAEGNVTIASHLKETVDTYIVYIKEFSGRITKCVVMRDYSNALVNERGGVRSSAEGALKDGIKKEGFLFYKHEYEEKIENIFSVFMDCAGSGMWHNVKSLGEQVFVQCRQYDFTMNAVMDAVKVNMSLMIQASTPEATEKIKSLVFGPYTIIPSDTPFVQQRFALPTTEATQTVQFMMLDMFRGIGEYRIHERAQGGEAPTATQSQLDAAESAKLSGTQLKRFNHQQTIHFRKIFKWLTEGVSSGEKDYEYYQMFTEYLEERGVPKEAWKSKNIESITSNMISGAGSPSFKIMAAEKTIEFTNISPKDEGQANAIEDGIAALHGRDNVARYIQKVKPNKTYNEEKAGHENSLLSNPFLNPADVQVQPEDEDLYHLNVHFADMERTVALVNENLEKGNVSEFIAESASYKLLNQVGHVVAHIDKLSRDTKKQKYTREATARLGNIEKGIQEMSKKMKQAKEQKQASYDPMNDPELQRQVAKNQLEIAHEKQMMDIKAAGTAMSHQQRLEQDKEKHAVEIAGKRAKQAEEIKQSKRAPKGESKPSPNK